MKIVLITLGIVISLAILALTVVMYSGIFNVATGWQDPPLVRLMLVNIRESSIERRAESIQVPVLDRAQQIENGFRSYREMCAICHTPPGGKKSPLVKGLNPEPPDLTKDQDHMSAAGLFWVIKHGIRMTGMPAWGPTHDDAEVWDIVAFVKTLPNLGAADYRALDRRLPPEHNGVEEH